MSNVSRFPRVLDDDATLIRVVPTDALTPPIVNNKLDAIQRLQGVIGVVDDGTTQGGAQALRTGLAHVVGVPSLAVQNPRFPWWPQSQESWYSIAGAAPGWYINPAASVRFSDPYGLAHITHQGAAGDVILRSPPLGNVDDVRVIARLRRAGLGASFDLGIGFYGAGGDTRLTGLLFSGNGTITRTALDSSFVIFPTGVSGLLAGGSPATTPANFSDAAPSTPAGMTDFVLGAVMTAQSNYDSNHTPPLAADNDDSTYWQATNGQGWLKADLGAPHTVQQVRLLQVGTGGTNATANVTLSTSDDGATYTDRAVHGVLAADETWTLTAPITARYWKIAPSVGGTEYGWRVFAWSLYGVAATGGGGDGGGTGGGAGAATPFSIVPGAWVYVMMGNAGGKPSVWLSPDGWSWDRIAYQWATGITANNFVLTTGAGAAAELLLDFIAIGRHDPAGSEGV